MNAEICRLLERAKPLRLLSPDEAESAGLGKLVDQINALRKQEADAEREAALASIKANLGAPDDGADPGEIAAAQAFEANPWPAEAERRAALAKRKPGRPKKAD